MKNIISVAGKKTGKKNNTKQKYNLPIWRLHSKKKTLNRIILYVHSMSVDVKCHKNNNIDKKDV